MEKTQAIELKATIPTSHFSVDGDGNLVIKNRELADKVQAFLSSEEGKNIAVAEYFLLCCTLKKPEILK
jgi:hypothetical protein